MCVNRRVHTYSLFTHKLEDWRHVPSTTIQNNIVNQIRLGYSTFWWISFFHFSLHIHVSTCNKFVVFSNHVLSFLPLLLHWARKKWAQFWIYGVSLKRHHFPSKQCFIVCQRFFLSSLSLFSYSSLSFKNHEIKLLTTANPIFILSSLNQFGSKVLLFMIVPVM